MQLEYAVSRFAVRSLLARYLTLNAQDIDLRSKTWGEIKARKNVATRQSIQVSLSHCGSCIAVALSKKARIGVDIECILREDVLTQGVSRYLLKAERTATTPRQIWDCWCRKEALLKGLRLGLSGLLSHIPALTEKINSIRVLTHKLWTIKSMAIHPDYSLAWAVAGGDRRIRVFCGTATSMFLSYS